MQSFVVQNIWLRIVEYVPAWKYRILKYWTFLTGLRIVFDNQVTILDTGLRLLMLHEYIVNTFNNIYIYM